MATKVYSAQIEIPQGITVDVTNNTVNVKGSKGDLLRTFQNPRVTILKEGNAVILKSTHGNKFSQVDKMIINTYRAHIRNMFDGVAKGYTAKLKVCSGHFPMNVSIDGDTFIIKNFLGEKVPRKVKLMDGVKIKLEGDIVTLNGLDKDKVGQTAARIEQLTRIINRDRRIFQDGCYIISKPGDEDE